MSAPLSAGARVPSPNYGSAANAPRTAKPTSTAGRAAAAADRAIDAVSVRPRFQYVAAAILGIGNASDAVEVLCLSFVLDAYDVSDAEKGALSSAVFIGMLFGGLIAGFMGDAWGRRPLLLAALVLNAVAGAASGALPYWQWLTAWRVAAGLGVGGSVPTLFTLMAEFAPSAHRGYFISLVAVFWMVGTIVAAGTAWLMIGVAGLGWRPFVVACAAPGALSALATWALLPESPRYLAHRGQTVAAVRALERIAAWNGARNVDVADIMLGGGGAGGAGGTGEAGRPDGAEDEPEDDAEASGAGAAAATGRGRGGCAGACGVVTGTVGALLSRRLRRTSLLLSAVFFTLSFGWYGLNAWVPTLFDEKGLKLSRYQDSFLVAAANLPGNIVATLLVDRVGRKPLLAGSLALACACAIGFAFATTEAAVVAAACLINAVSVCSWNTLDALMVEMFPTRLRASAAGLIAAVGRVGSIVAQLVFSALVRRSIPAVLAIAAGMLLCGAVAGCALPREPGRTGLVEDEEPDGGADVELPYTADGGKAAARHVAGPASYAVDEPSQEADTAPLKPAR